MPQPMSFIIKVVNTCNMACNYCYLPLNRQVGVQVIPDDYILKIIKGTAQMGISDVQFVWHGGEPLLAGLSFYQRAVQLQREFGQPWQRFDNVMQSNGLLINDKWIKFFVEHHFGVGVSVDGQAKIHDLNRLLVGGSATYSSVIGHFTQLKKNGCDGGICAVVNSDSIGCAKEIVDHFARLNVPEIDFLPCFRSEANPDSLTKSISAEQYGEFMVQAFDRWIELDQPGFQIRFFHDVILMLMGGRSNFCKFTPEKCSKFLAVNYNGEVYPCDNFVGAELWRMGSLAVDDLPTILSSETRRKFIRSMSFLDDDCQSCMWLQVCWGGCTYHRYLANPTLLQKTVFCQARKRILAHISNVLEIKPDIVRSRALTEYQAQKSSPSLDAYLNVGRGCNSRCYFCATDSTNQVEPIKEVQLHALQACRKSGATALVISGGEATLQPRLLELCAYAQKEGFTRIQLQSNGRRLAQVEFVKELLTAGISEFGLSLHGPTAPVHDAITGRHGSFMQTVQAIENIRLLLGANPPLAVNCVIAPENLTYLTDIAKLLLSWDVSTIKFAYLHGTGRATALLQPGRWPRKSAVVPYLIEVIKTVEKMGRPHTTLAIEAIPPCLLRGYETYCSDTVIQPVLAINPDGTVEEFTTASERVKQATCKHCTWDSRCLGPWKQYPLAYGWSEFTPIASGL